MDETQTVVGGTWDDRDDPHSRGCAVSFGVAGRTFSALRIGSAVLDSSIAIAAVSDLWRQRGYTVTRIQVGPVTQLLATGVGGEQLILRFSDRATTLQGESECRPE